MIVRLVIGLLLMACVALALSGCTTIVINPAANAGPRPPAGPNPCASVNCNATNPFTSPSRSIA